MRFVVAAAIGLILVVGCTGDETALEETVDPSPTASATLTSTATGKSVV